MYACISDGTITEARAHPTQDWQLENFPNLAGNSNPAEGIKSPLFSLLRAIVVPKMSSAGNVGVFISQEGDGQ